jgi:hypothetical protein
MIECNLTRASVNDPAMRSWTGTTALPPTRQFAPAVPNAGFAPHCRRSDARGLTSQIDPEATFMTEPPGGPLPGKRTLGSRATCGRPMAFIRRSPDMAMAQDRAPSDREVLSDAVPMYCWITHHGRASEIPHQGGPLDLHRGAKRRGREASTVPSWARKLRIVPNSFQLRPALPPPHGAACSCSARPRRGKCRSS